MLAADFPTTARIDASFPADEQAGFAPEVYSATNIQRPTVLGWAFSFVASPSHAGFRAILRVPATPPVDGMTRPVRPCSALSSLETRANFFVVANAGGASACPRASSTPTTPY